MGVGCTVKTNLKNPKELSGSGQHLLAFSYPPSSHGHLPQARRVWTVTVGSFQARVVKAWTLSNRRVLGNVTVDTLSPACNLAGTSDLLRLQLEALAPRAGDLLLASF